jgi:hypothetical protein
MSRPLQIYLGQIPFYYILPFIIVPFFRAVILQQFLLVVLFYPRAMTLYLRQIPHYYILLSIIVLFLRAVIFQQFLLAVPFYP